MEDERERVLAYLVAKVLDQTILAKIAGGNMNPHQTFYPSGTDVASVDYRFDY